MNQMEQLIANLCDADKRTTDPQTHKAAEVILVHNVNEWCKSVSITQQERGQNIVRTND